ncbi:YitT family protein [Ectobacillus panaciterrae]|uniref:YitT family protein n=1 Tax=Ectobacillus panaciterrae TaxID=363872 RepID=UPI00040BC04D|nr:YitT family protein [Ectobacillus panaciterrae]
MIKIINILFGCLITSIGVLLLRHAHIITGGTAGLSLSLSYILNMPFATLFFAVNIPFYVFSFIRMGWKFTVSTIFAVTILSLMTGVDRWLPPFSIPALLGAVVGGIIIGFGLSILFLNNSSLGGANILALFLQKRFNWNPGKINFLFDFLVVISGIYSVGVTKGIYSILSISIISSIISYFKNKIANRDTAEKDAKNYSLKSKMKRVG